MDPALRAKMPDRSPTRHQNWWQRPITNDDRQLLSILTSDESSFDVSIAATRVVLGHKRVKMFVDYQVRTACKVTGLESSVWHRFSAFEKLASTLGMKPLPRTLRRSFASTFIDRRREQLEARLRDLLAASSWSQQQSRAIVQFVECEPLIRAAARECRYRGASTVDAVRKTGSRPRPTSTHNNQGSRPKADENKQTDDGSSSQQVFHWTTYPAPATPHAVETVEKVLEELVHTGYSSVRQNCEVGSLPNPALEPLLGSAYRKLSSSCVAPGFDHKEVEGASSWAQLARPRAAAPPRPRLRSTSCPFGTARQLVQACGARQRAAAASP